MRTASASLVALFASLLALAGCDSTEPSTPTALAKVSGDQQVGPAGEPLPAPLVVSVADQHGNPMSGVEVTWTVAAGGGALSPTTVATDGNGQSRVTWTLGASVGSNGVSATVAGLTPATFTASAEPGPPARLVMAAGAGQRALAAAAVAESLAVKVTDRHGNGVPNVAVRWAVQAGDGRVSPTTSTTSATGLARTAWVLGRHAGSNTVTATAGALDGSPHAFEATATPNGTITGDVSFSGGMVSYSRLPAARGEPAVEERAAGGAAPGVGRSAAHAATGRPVMNGPDRTPEPRLIVVFRRDGLRTAPGVALSRAQARLLDGEIRDRLARPARTLGFTVSGVSPAIRAARLEVAAGQMEPVMRALRADPAIASVEPEVWRYPLDLRPTPRATRTRRVVPNDPLFGAQSWHYNLIDLGRAWRQTTGSPSVTVAVIDDGIRFDHPDIARNLTQDGYDFVSAGLVGFCGRTLDNAGDGHGYDVDPTVPVAYDCAGRQLYYAGGHGLHVAGTIGAVGNDGYGVSGVNWQVKIRPIRALGIAGGGSYDIAQAVLYAAGLPADDGRGGQVQASSPARIINLSLGSVKPSALEETAIGAAAAAGSLIVAAAGNEGVSAPFYPAAYPEVLSVAAVDPYGRLASYSNYGGTIDIAAPGGDSQAGGADFMVGSLGWDFSRSEPTWLYAQGTSMAAPHVAGVAALVLAAEPSLTAAQLRQRLVDYAHDLGAPGRDDRFGAGLVSARNSLARSRTRSGNLHARLYDPTTGALLQSVPATNTTFTFRELADQDYQVFAGYDEEGDGVIGVPGLPWGGYTVSGALGTVTVDGAGTYSADFDIGFPREREPDDGGAEPSRLVVDGYAHGLIESVRDADPYTITLPAGLYTFETSGWNDDACGYATAVDTRLELLSRDGALFASNDDTSEGSCSRITRDLPAGTYVVRVSGSTGSGYYRIEARRGP